MLPLKESYLLSQIIYGTLANRVTYLSTNILSLTGQIRKKLHN